MNGTKIRARTKSKIGYSRILQDIPSEVRQLRSELLLFFPQENLTDYAHPDRIKRSYQKAVKRYAAVSVWK